MSDRNELTAERLRELLHYEPKTGTFTWIKSRVRPAGEAAGYLLRGYRVISIGSHSYLAHRLAWLWMTGAWPTGQIDHINLKRNNNQWSNLREATAGQQIQNTRASSTNTSGFKGVSWSRQTRKWLATIRINGKSTYLGRFATPERAWLAYALAARKHFGKFARIEAGGVTFFLD